MSSKSLKCFFNVEDKCDDRLEELNKELHEAKKAKDKGEIAKIKADMNKYANERKEARKASKAEMDKHAMFNRAADAYITSRKLPEQTSSILMKLPLSMMRQRQELRLKKRLRSLKTSVSVKSLRLSLQSAKLQEERNNFKYGIFNQEPHQIIDLVGKRRKE